MTDLAFAALYGRAPDVRAAAPGRVNLIGEHTDYNGGYVLPTAIPQRTAVELAARDDDLVRAASASVGGPAPLEYRVCRERRQGAWIDYVQGVTAALAARGLGAPRGFELLVRSDVPPGSGLSSSAALAVALLRALRERFGLPLDDVALSLVAQRAEVDFVGAPVGLMDPLACSFADAATALFIDTRTLALERVPLPASLALVVIDSGIRHDHAGGDYRVRRAECQRAAALLGVPQLRDLDAEGLARASSLPAALPRRVRHVVTENRRVLDAVAALRASDVAALGALFHASHASMRDDYEVSVPDVDRLVAIADADPDVAGSRLTGGGFGGAVIILAREGRDHAAGERIAGTYARQTGRTPRVLVPTRPAPPGDHDVA